MELKTSVYLTLITRKIAASFPPIPTYSPQNINNLPTLLNLTICVQIFSCFNSFLLKQYALLTKSGYMSQVDFHPPSAGIENDITLHHFPGGPATFEVIVKFCYDLPIDLSPNNVALLRCASEFLEMTEEFEDGNLISKTEAFLAFIVLASWRDSIIVLKTCEDLSPWAENLQIVRRCCDFISWKTFQNKNEIIDDEAWWLDDLATLHIDHFGRIITVLKSKGTEPDIIGSCIQHYAANWLPTMDGDTEGRRRHWYGKNELHFSIICGTNQEGELSQHKEQKMIIESLISILPPQKETVSCKFLLWMLKIAVIYSATPALISELEKRVGSVLQDAEVQDLLIPRSNDKDRGKVMK